MKRVAVIGIAQTKFESRIIDRNYADMIYQVTKEALDDAGMTIDQIDNVVTVSNDFWDGRTISSMAVLDACGSYGKNVSTVEGDGAFGALYGAMRVMSGSYGTTLVVAHSKASDGDPSIITNAMFDPIYQRPLGLDGLSSAALQAHSCIIDRNMEIEDWARVSVKNHQNAQKNPYAHLPMDISVEDVLSSPLLADPLKKLDCASRCDGACALILAEEERVQKSGQKPVWISGMGYAADWHYLGDRNLSEPQVLAAASRKAYEQANILNPAEQIDFFEIYDEFSYMEPLWLEGLGICSSGEGGKWTREGKTSAEGSHPVNVSGGVISSHAEMVAGLVRVIEVVLQIRKTAGEHQLDKADIGLAHGTHGPCGQSHCVLVLSENK